MQWLRQGTGNSGIKRGETDIKKRKPLTVLQQALVEQHLDLVRICIRRYIDVNESICGMGYDDLYQEGCEALCHAAASYDGREETQFSTYAGAVIRNHLLDHCRYIRAKRRSAPVVSLDSNEEGGVPGEQLAVYDDRDRQLDRICLSQLLEHGRRTYSGTARLGIEAMELMVSGCTGADIARLYGIKPNLVGARIARAVERLKKDAAVLERQIPA